MLASLNSRPVVRPELDPRIHSVLLQRNSSPRFSSLDIPVRGPPLPVELEAVRLTLFFPLVRGVPFVKGKKSGYVDYTT